MAVIGAVLAIVSGIGLLSCTSTPDGSSQAGGSIVVGAEIVRNADRAKVLKLEKVIEVGDCTVWRFTDTDGTHYIAEGRYLGRGSAALACTITR